MKFNQVFFEAVDAGSGSGNEELNADSILAKLNAPNNEKEENEPKSEENPDDNDESKESSESAEKEEEVEVDLLAELEDELKEPSEEDLELKTPVQRRELMKDYPDIFKKHPGLESTIYRERAYTEILPTIADAKEAKASLETLERFERDLNKGNTVDIMRAVEADDKKAFARLVDNYLPNLHEVNPQAHDHVIGNITKDIVESMLKFGKDSGNEEVQAAASIVYQFMFNSTKWQPKQKLAVDDIVNDSIARDKSELDKQKQEFETSKLNEHTTKLMSSVNNQIKGTIEKSIDAKDQMTPFVKSKAIDEVLKKADEHLKQDKRFQQIVKGLTDRSKKENYSDESLKRIRSAYFSKYNAILIPIIKSVRAEALKGNTKTRTKLDVENNDTTERANRADTTSRNSNSGTKQDLSKPLPGESSSEFLLRRAGK